MNHAEAISMREGPHALLCKFLSRATGLPAVDGCKYPKIEMPRDTGMTTLGGQDYPVWRLCRYPGMSILLANEKGENAETMLGAVKQEFENNELFRALFPELIPPEFPKTAW